MKAQQIIMLLGGLALFLYGMQKMSDGLEAVAGNRLKSILERLTSNRFLGVGVGAVITAIIQSSSATTVMVVGFVNSGIMNLEQAIWIIMGANIGTTITGQLIALDISAVAPLIAFVGVVLVLMVKNKQVKSVGEIIAGLGVLFIGMDMMSSSMVTLQNSPAFVNAVSTFRNPLIGILAGAIFTAIIQSSSASVGILQALVGSGVLGLPSAVYVLFGQNIGTCITAVLASIGAKRNAKRTTIIHLVFNIFGTIMFTTICVLTPFASFVGGLTPGNAIAGVANMHTIFNIVTTIVLLPFGGYLAKLARVILPGKETNDDEYICHLPPIPKGTYQLGTTTVVISEVARELKRMLHMATENVRDSFDAVLNLNVSKAQEVEDREEYIDCLNKDISNYIGRLVSMKMAEEDSRNLTGYYYIVSNIERIGDHAMNLYGYAKTMSEKKMCFSAEAKRELEEMKTISLETLSQIDVTDHSEKNVVLEVIAKKEQKIDDLNEQFHRKQLDRIKEGSCNMESGILYSEMLTDFERIGDHALNIAEKYSEMGTLQ